MSDQRILPILNNQNRHFWTSGATGELQILRCADCGFWLHPPLPVCSSCLSRNIAPAPVSGKGTVWSFTINMRAWSPRLEKPYAIAIVALAEQEGLHLTTKLMNVDPNAVHIGMPVEVVFEQDEDVWLPFFQPAKK